MFDALWGKRILELGNPGFIWRFYEVFRESGSFQISAPPSLDVVLIPVIQYSCCHSTHYIHTPDSKRGIKRRAYFSVPHITSTYLCTEPSQVATLHISVSSHCIPTNHKVAMAYNTKYLFSRIYAWDLTYLQKPGTCASGHSGWADWILTAVLCGSWVALSHKPFNCLGPVG